jgi:hypothetical protein
MHALAKGWSGRLEMTEQARADRLARQVRGLARQVEQRAMLAETAQRCLEEKTATIDAQRRELESLRAELSTVRAAADEYDRVMSTKTMRALRIPRQSYARLRALLPRAGATTRDWRRRRRSAG